MSLLDAAAKVLGLGRGSLSGEEARRLVADGALLVDVRSPAEFARGHLPGAVNLPIGEVEERYGELPADRPLVLYCSGGVRSKRAADFLSERTGLGPIHDLGRIDRW